MDFMEIWYQNLFIHDEYNTAIIENILKRQKIVMKQVKKEKEAYGRTNIDPESICNFR